MEFVYHDRSQCDLSDFTQTQEYFEKIKPHYVIHLAAKVGGLYANMSDKVNFME